MATPTSSQVPESVIRSMLAQRCGWKSHDSSQILEKATRDALTAGAISALRSEAADEVPDSDFGALVNRLAVHESYFLRDPQLFDILQEQVLPQLARTTQHQLRIWSAGCAKGEEAYTLAAIARDAGLGSKVSILATDLASAAVAAGIAGQYSPWSVRGGQAVSRGIVVPGPAGLTVAPELKTMTTFQQMNLLDVDRDVVPAGLMDLILCRNVLIYMNPSAIERIAHQLFDSLRPGGYLVCAPSDPDLSKYGRLTRVRFSNRVLLQRPGTEVPKPRRPARSTPPPARRPATLEPKTPSAKSTPTRPKAKGRPQTTLSASSAPVNPSARRVEQRSSQPDMQAPVGGDALTDSGSAQLLDDTFAEAMATGVRELEVSSYDTAIAELRRAMCVRPESIFALRMLSVAYLAAGEYKRASSTLSAARRQLLTLDPAAEVPGFEGSTLDEVSDDLLRIERAVARGN